MFIYPRRWSLGEKSLELNSNEGSNRLPGSGKQEVKEIDPLLYVSKSLCQYITNKEKLSAQVAHLSLVT